MYNIFLDDLRKPKDVSWVELPNVEWIIVRSYKEFRNLVWEKGIPKFVTYDHDLSDAHYGHGLNYDEIPYETYFEKTGYDCAKFLVNECNKLGVKHPPFSVHSMNPVGAKNIFKYIERYNETLNNNKSE